MPKINTSEGLKQACADRKAEREQKRISQVGSTAAQKLFDKSWRKYGEAFGKALSQAGWPPFDPIRDTGVTVRDKLSISDIERVCEIANSIMLTELIMAVGRKDVERSERFERLKNQND